MAATRPALARVPYASPRCFVGKASVVTMLSAFHAATETPLKTWMGRREGGNKRKIRIRTIKKAATLLSAELQHARTPLPRGQPQRACLGAPLCPTSQRARWKAPGKRQAKQRQLKGVRGGSSENTTVGNIDRHPSEHPQHTSARRKLSGRKLTQDAIRVPVKSSTMRMPKTLIAERVIETMRVQIEPCRCNRTAGNGGGQLAPNIERSRANWDAGAPCQPHLIPTHFLMLASEPESNQDAGWTYHVFAVDGPQGDKVARQVGERVEEADGVDADLVRADVVARVVLGQPKRDAVEAEAECHPCVTRRRGWGVGGGKWKQKERALLVLAPGGPVPAAKRAGAVYSQATAKMAARWSPEASANAKYLEQRTI